MNITNSIYTIRTLTETAKQSRDVKNIFPSNIVAKSCKCLAKLLKLQEAAGCRLNKTILGFVPPSPVLLSPAPTTVRMHFCALLVFSNSFIEFKPNILLFWLKNMYFCANLSTEYFLIENEILIVMRPSKIYSIWLWTFCGFCEIPYFMEVKC